MLEDETTAGVWPSAGWCQTTNNQLDKLEYQMSNLRGGRASPTLVGLS